MKHLTTIAILFISISCFGQLDDIFTGELHFGYGVGDRIEKADMIDTIYVAVLCEVDHNIDGSFPLYNGEVKTKGKQMERTLEWRQRGQSYPSGDSFSWIVWNQESQWIIKSYRWIDSVNGCYQLIPLSQPPKQ